MSAKYPFVSIILAYNEEKYSKKCIESLISQTYLVELME